MSLRQPGHRPSFLLLSGQSEGSVLCVGLSTRPVQLLGHQPLGSTVSPPTCALWVPGIYRCPLPPVPLWIPGIYRCAPQPVPLWVPASPQDSRGHSLLAVHAVAVHVPFPLHVEAWEGLPVLVHTPAETPLPALGRAALWAEHRLSETWGGPALGGPINGAGAQPPGWFPSAVSATLRKHN